jgi:hypothetical protein
VLHSLLLALAFAAPAAPAADAQSRDQARKLTVQSIREYNLGHYEPALTDIERAYELSGLPALLYNLGQCHRMLGHWKKAEFFYRGYLREKRDAANRAEVVHLIELVQAAEKNEAAPTAAQQPVVAPAPAAPTSPPPLVIETAPPPATPPVPAAAVTEAPDRSGPPASTWWIGGSGAALAVCGGVAGVLAGVNGNNDNGINHSVTGSAYVTGQYEGLTADVLWGVGGALIITAAIVALTSH